MEATWDATYLTCPYGGSKDSDTSQLPPVVTTYFNSVNEKNYTVNINDMASLFDSVDKHEWLDMHALTGLLTHSPPYTLTHEQVGKAK